MAGENLRYTAAMSWIVRSAMVQMRPTAEIKLAAEHLLQRSVPREK
jgi:hypothetical protein